MEGGELFDRVVNEGQLREDVAKIYFYQIVEAIKVSFRETRNL